MSIHKVTALRTGFTNGMDWEAEYEVTFNFVPGAVPILYPPDNADPGWPPEVDLVSVTPVSPDPLTHREVEEWAQNWLQTDGYSEALAAVEEDDERAREYQAELRREDF